MTEQTVVELAKINFEKWNQSLATGEADVVADMYSDDATFLPTVSGDFKRGKKGAAEYFVHFLEKNPTGSIVEDDVRLIGEDTYVHAGIYEFELGSQDDRNVVAARFTFIWKNENGHWTIIHHHSSVRPK